MCSGDHRCALLQYDLPNGFHPEILSEIIFSLNKIKRNPLSAVRGFHFFFIQILLALPISGDYPKDLVIFPDNKHIAVANHASNTVTTFTVDYDKNIIVMNDKPHHIETP